MGMKPPGQRERARLVCEARRFAAHLMTDRCVVTRAGEGDPTLDDTTGVIVEPAPATVYEGRCKVRMAQASAAVMQVAGGALTMQQATLTVPVQVVLRRGDIAQIVASDDPGLIGRRLTIRAEHATSGGTAHRYMWEELG